MEMVETNSIVQFLRWTGSKRWFVKNHLNKFLPPTFNNYHEPFLGGGAVFFFIRQNLVTTWKRKFYLSDTNNNLINVYEQVRDNVDDVIGTLNKFKNTKDDYYKIRAYSPRTAYVRAAKFIYLNRTSFNGIYRVNSNGEYNVPYGYRKNVDFVTVDALRNVSKLLKNTHLTSNNFDNSLKFIKKNDLVFLDPPYTVAHENNGFIEYNQKLFSWEDQEKLKEMVEKIKQKEAYFILTNASHKSIRELYKNTGKMTLLSRPSIIGGRTQTRGMYNEIIITNF